MEHRVYKTEQELKNMARELSRVIYLRSEKGSVARAATDVEQDTLSNIFCGALLELNRKTDPTWEYAIQNTAEMTADLFMPYINGYDTVFIPLDKVLRNWEREEEWKW